MCDKRVKKESADNTPPVCTLLEVVKNSSASAFLGQENDLRAIRQSELVRA